MRETLHGQRAASAHRSSHWWTSPQCRPILRGLLKSRMAKYKSKFDSAIASEGKLRLESCDPPPRVARKRGDAYPGGVL